VTDAHGKAFHRLDKVLARAEFALIAAFTLAALALGVTQVVLRYGFNTGLAWSETIFILFTVAGMLFAGSRAVAEDKHVRVDLLYMVIPDRLRRAFILFAHVVTGALCAFYAVCGFLYVRFVHMIDTVQVDTGIPDWIVYLLVPVTMGAFALRYVIRIARALRGEDAVTPHALPAAASAAEAAAVDTEGRA
jgi:TRAP-type C4-dicarboxylate transport system permease small subunit